MRRVYMKVTLDKYETPLAVADSITELAQITGTTHNNIISAMSHAKARGQRSRYIAVDIDDEEDPEWLN